MSESTEARISFEIEYYTEKMNNSKRNIEIRQASLKEAAGSLTAESMDLNYIKSLVDSLTEMKSEYLGQKAMIDELTKLQKAI